MDFDSIAGSKKRIRYYFLLFRLIRFLPIFTNLPTPSEWISTRSPGREIG